MSQIMTGVPAQKSPFHARAAAATVADVMRPPLTTVNQHDHVAAAAYLMKHAGTTALMVVEAQTGQPAGIITEADVAHAIADGKDVNDVWADAVMTTRPAIITTTSIRDAATIMTTRHFRFAAGVFLDAFVVRLTLVPAVMAIAGSRLWYHPQWFARHIPDPDIEGQRLDRELAEAELAPAGTSARQG